MNSAVSTSAFEDTYPCIACRNPTAIPKSQHLNEGEAVMCSDCAYQHQIKALSYRLQSAEAILRAVLATSITGSITININDFKKAAAEGKDFELRDNKDGTITLKFISSLIAAPVLGFKG